MNQQPEEKSESMVPNIPFNFPPISQFASQNPTGVPHQAFLPRLQNSGLAQIPPMPTINPVFHSTVAPTQMMDVVDRCIALNDEMSMIRRDFCLCFNNNKIINDRVKKQLNLVQGMARECIHILEQEMEKCKAGISD